MGQIKIDADLEQTALTFEYSGADLLQPLVALREHLLAQAQKLRSTLPAAEQNAPPPGLRDLGKQNEIGAVQNKIAALMGEAFEAQLWAAECKRKPEQTFRLRMTQLRWIYQQHKPV